MIQILGHQDKAAAQIADLKIVAINFAFGSSLFCLSFCRVFQSMSANGLVHKPT